MSEPKTNSKFKLTGDEKYALQLVITNPGFKAALKVLKELVEDQERMLLDLSAETAPPNTLLVKKAKAEGARKLANEYTRYLENLLTKKNAND